MSKRNKKRKGKNPNRWLLILALAGIVVLTVGLLLALNGERKRFVPAVTGQPAIEVGNQLLDYGQVKLGSVIDASVKVTNNGDRLLRFVEKPYIELIEGC